MSQFLKLVSIILILGCFTCGCSSQSGQVPTNIPTADLTPLTSYILVSNEINASNLLKVDDGLEISDRSDCLPKDCAHSIWNILDQETQALTVTNSPLELAILLRSFQTAEEANSSAVKIVSEHGGQPGYRMIETHVNILPEQSWAYAHAGWFVVLSTTHGNIQIALTLSDSSGGIGIDESEQAIILLENVAKTQIDKLMLAKNK